MAKVCIQLTVKTALWVRPYINSVRLFCEIFNTTPDIEKMTKFICKHGIKITHNRDLVINHGDN
jgi:hypothetical protein